MITPFLPASRDIKRGRSPPKQHTTATPGAEVEAHARPNQQANEEEHTYALYFPACGIVYVVLIVLVRSKPFGQKRRVFVGRMASLCRGTSILERWLDTHEQGEGPAAGGTWPCQCYASARTPVGRW